MKTGEKRLELAKLLLMFVLIVAIEICLGKVASVLGDSLGVTIPTFLRVIVLDICLVIPVFVYAIKKGDSIVESFGFKKIKGKTVLLTILLTFVSYPMWMLANILSQFFVPNVMVQAVDQFVSESMLLTLFVTAICAPVAEEIICRGFFANRLKGVMPFIAAAIVSGLMFGILHLNINQFSYAFVLGIIFAYVNRASGSVFTSMIMHFVINAGNMCLLFLAKYAMELMGSNLAETAEVGRADTYGMAKTAITLAVLSVISFFLSRKIIRSIAATEGNEQ
jgi:membrane protease YdiL (CAAX protease family)